MGTHPKSSEQQRDSGKKKNPFLVAERLFPSAATLGREREEKRAGNRQWELSCKNNRAVLREPILALKPGLSNFPAA